MEIPDDHDDIDPELVYFRCPNGHLGRIDQEQLDGDVSIVCTGEHDGCDFHGFIGEGEIVPKTPGP